MPSTLIALCATLAASLSLEAQSPPAGDTTLVITNVSILPMDRERVLTNQTVVVERGTITRLGPAGSITTPAGARTIDGTGSTSITMTRTSGAACLIAATRR